MDREICEVEEERMTEERLVAFGEAWARKDIETLMTFITEDCVYSASVGPEPGCTYVGREEVRRGFLEMLARDAAGQSVAGKVWVAGDRGVAEWGYLHTLPDGRRYEVRGCDLFEFAGNRIRRKDAFRKVFPEPAPAAG